MNINRNNYEEYFLLYADKELSAEAENMVEMFVQQNPDLEEEFIMLQQSVVKPDNNITLEDKSSLFKKEGIINLANYEEKFLQYTDNELSPAESEETEKFVLQNPAFQHEFTLLQQATYEPDTSIVFPDKNLLYKKEDDNKVIPFPWRYLAAAILLGIGLWAGIGYLQKKDDTPEIAIKQTLSKEKKSVKIIEPKKVETTPLVKIDDKKITPGNKKIREDLNNIQKQPQQNAVVKNILSNNVPAINKIPEQKKEDVVIADISAKNNDAVKINGLPEPVNSTSEPTVKTVTSGEAPQNNYAQTASYIEEAEIKSENYVFYNITAEEFRKSKVGNFLKKVKRTIERKIPLKNNSFKIGNVEIAKDDQN